ncbi:DMT family transporter [Ancylobacter amanitiformis]|uniref:Drug/metabolite transporter (DMT)-like permease n=1 Tax=Ancylobacter amanitiformis TaxID=217069 RepID=A0ABU0LP39_9HYPH|nr:EamA family transporter [Ancylobacter amanitiformis]MDQ0510405.1 drug/metabolite transporter (DMT)-like permease [Ancylobacter amanitiformis]
MTSSVADRGPAPAIPLSAYIHLVIIYVVWGGSYLAVKVSLSGPAAITVLQLQSSRLWCASLLLGAVTLARYGWPPLPNRRDLALCAVSGLFMWMGGNGLATLAARHASSSFIVMMMGAIPLWACLLDLIIGRTIPSLRVVLGILLGLAGLFLVVSPALLETHRAIIEPGYTGFTILLVVAAGLSWSLGTIIQRPLMRRIRPDWAASFQMFVSAIVLSSLALYESAPLPVDPSTRQWLAFGFLTVFASVIGLSSYLKVLTSFSPVVASTFAYVNPIVGVLLGWMILGEELSAVSLLGLAVVLASIAIVLRRRR